MTTIYIYKAQKTINDVEPVTINITIEVPSRASLKQQRDLFEDEALKLCEALENTLPGGTFDRLLAEMMKRRASSFAVTLKE